MMLLPIIVSAAAVCICPPSYLAKVERVIDGDTLVVDIDLGFQFVYNDVHVRLADIDTPEIRGVSREEKLQGYLARSFVVQWVEAAGGTVYLTHLGTGKYGRPLVQLRKDRCGKTLAAALKEARHSK